MRMQRLIPYFGIAAALAAFIAVSAVIQSSPALEEAAAPVASSTLSVVPSYAPPSLSLPTPAELASSTRTSSGPKNPPAPPTKETASPPPPAPAAPAPSPVALEAPPQSEDIGLDASASLLRTALVNIICYVSAGSGLHSISGSGVFVDSKGIILTNAHVAQYFLLADRGASCTIRTGSPAKEEYRAQPIFVSPSWIRANPTVLTQTDPSGTGEFDYAFVAVTKSANGGALPDSFPSVSLAIQPPRAGTPVVIASYGAQFLESTQVVSNLFPIVVFGSVKDVFTFALNTVDVLALGGSAAAQEGSSGGGIADASGKLVGTITTSTTSGTTDTRSLTAITASYIRAAYASETASALDLLLSQPTATSIAAFAQRIPELEAIITAQLQ